uniref:Protein PFC0760c-like isoform X2 n=1 Tax=Dermatophagoides pteronyssinus TaxID=6956 RepID=A0A6P6Y6N3_DERPT|nr:protein PFC0760c-like isoform X2 [Dermatophagoides pteronyssinus]
MSTNIRALLLNVRQNLPPLNDKQKEKPKEIILIDSSTTTKNSLIQQFHLNCKKNESEKNEENCRSLSKTAESWLKIREKMLIEMEEKRNLEWEQENLTKRLENEEGEEEEVILTDDDIDEDDGDGNSDNLEEKPEDNEEEPEEAHDDHVSINSDDDDDDEDLKDIEDKDEQELDENIQSDDQNADDQDDDNDDDECIFSSRKSKPLPLSDDDNDDDGEENETEKLEIEEEMGENIIDTFDYFDRQDDDQNRNYNYNEYVSQNLPLTPIDAVVVDNENHQNQNHQQKNQFDSQMLLELCSGRFNDDQGDDEVVVADDDDDESETLQKTNRKPKKSLKIKDFIEDEAELSDADDANDISSDESDDENQDQEFIENLIDEEGEGIPDDQDELREQVEKIHHKNMLDEDKRQLMIMKEYFFEDGDLYDADGHNNRRKKFKWTLNRNNDEDDLINTVVDDDSDSENGDSIEEDDGQPTNIRLKRTIEQISVDDDEVEIDSNSNSSKLIAQKMMQLNSSKFANQFRKKKNQSSLTSYLIRDQRLKEVMTTTKNSDELSSSLKTKKLKTNDSISIFDVFNQQQ